MSARGGLGNSCGSILLFKMDNQDGCFLERPANLLAEDQVSHLRTLLSAQSNFESRLRQDVRSIMASIMREDGQVDIVVLASRLVLIGYKVSIRTAVGGGSGQECFRNLNYEFLLVSQSGSEAKELIVDARFREQFKLSQQTHRYSQLLNLLPEAFVGQHSMIVHLVKLLASEMETAFSETGITMPPWRQAGSMMSKWKPLKSKDTEVSSPTLGGASPRGALSLCSSRSSSSCSDCSPQRLRPLLSGGLQRLESIPMRIQSGFELESRPASAMRDERSQKASKLELWSQNSLCNCNGLLSRDNHECSKGVLQKTELRLPQAGFPTGPCKENLGLAKIRTVKLGVR